MDKPLCRKRKYTRSEDEAFQILGDPTVSEPLTVLAFTVPLVPPSVNRYVRHTRKGRHYVGAEAKAFKEAVRLCARGRLVGGAKAKTRYELSATIYLGFNQKGDGDNFWKVIADGLKEAGVIHSDAAVDNWLLFKRRDRQNPRTEICVKGL